MQSLQLPTSKLNQFLRKEIETIEDLMKYIPKEYLDFRDPVSIRELIVGEVQVFVGEIFEIRGFDRVAKMTIRDNFQDVIDVVWFNSSYVLKQYQKGEKVIVAGKVSENEYMGKKSVQIINPILFSKEIEENKKIIPVYSKIKGMSTSYLENTINKAFQVFSNEEKIEDELLRKYNLLKRRDAFEVIHFPQNQKQIKQGLETYEFEELFYYTLKMELQEGVSSKNSSFIPRNSDELEKLINNLPFQLTDGQSEVVSSIFRKMKKGERINSLIQGDVGCGKTIVAILLMLLMAENGFQSVLMAPTGVLAKQHYEDFINLFKNTSYQVAYLSGETKKRERNKILKEVREGKIHFLIGTHAVIQEDVTFHTLGLTVVDEEHRFGVKQRELLNKKSVDGVHSIKMSATPIPRSLALILYGNRIDIHTIKTLPKGRKPVRTVLFHEEERAYNGILQQINQGHQAYVVCPLIEDSDAESMEGVESVETTYQKLIKRFKNEQAVKIGMISGKMKAEEISEMIEKFSRNEINVLISTTIIEVGVNVPNATLIVIQNAERFGLAQLHQLRGRVGRSSLPSYCVLVSKKTNNRKLQAMTESTDGFYIAEVDMNIRGTGELVGVKQSGKNDYVDLIIKNMSRYSVIQKEVEDVINNPERINFYMKNIIEESEVCLQTV